MDDIYAIRRRNLNDLCKREANGNQSEMARQLDKAPNLINRYLTGGKPIGDDIAREVEQRYKLEVGWADNRHPASREEILLKAFRDADESLQQAAERVLGLTPFAILEAPKALKRRRAG